MSRGMDKAWELRKRGLQDSLRHDKLVNDAIKKNLRELIGEQSIITSDGHKTVRIPIRFLDQYRFKYGQPQQGVGQGQGNAGDVIGRSGQPGQGTGPDGQPGDQPGELTYEVDVELEELTKMMLEDLKLPWLEEKPDRQIVSETLQYTNLRRTGSMANLAKRKSVFRNVRRNAARGNPHVGNWHEDDLRFRAWDIHQEYHANAAVYMLMDRSGSMTTSKKYIAKSFFFWMVRFLRLKYEHVETIFIAHDTEAAVVDEKDFFALSNSGGTRCSSAYQVAREHLELKHPPSKWNNYVFHFSDGDNLPHDNETCKTLVKELIPQCSMVGYGEIVYRDDASFYGWMGGPTATFSTLQTKLDEIHKDKIERNERLVIAKINHKEQLYDVLQQFLSPKELAKV